MKILFLLKKNVIYGGYSSITSRSGLLNSTKFLVHSLLNHRIIKHAKIEMCDDGNSIDKAVHDYKPNICIIQALWVTPKKLEENRRLHPQVTFIVLIHSNIPFLAMEGIAIEWIKQYPIVGFNNEWTTDYVKNFVRTPIYLPNIDDKNEVEIEENIHKNHLNVGCFGSVRPLKNQLIQAVAALNYAEKHCIDLHFHINGNRIEQKGDPVLHNLRDLFEGTRHKLIEHDWMEHGQFIDLVRRMDVGLQVSFTESFNIVSADFVHAGVPIIVSPEISWQYRFLQVDPNNADEIQNKIDDVLRRRRHFAAEQVGSLKKYNKKALRVWKDFIDFVAA